MMIHLTIYSNAKLKKRTETKPNQTNVFIGFELFQLLLLVGGGEGRIDLNWI